MNSTGHVWRAFALLALHEECSALEAGIPSIAALTIFIVEDEVPQPVGPDLNPDRLTRPTNSVP